jgi:hypothetical protein
MPSRIYRIGRSRTGLGLFAIKPIKRNAYIATYRGIKLTNDEADRSDKRGNKYLFELNSLWTIDGSPRWNKARYINHSCRPNVKPVSHRCGIVFRAVRPIEPGEEITFNYGKSYHRYFVENGGCRCSACRARVASRRRRLAAARRAEEIKRSSAKGKATRRKAKAERKARPAWKSARKSATSRKASGGGNSSARKSKSKR